MSLKNIKVTELVKSQLDEYALDKETYNVTIQRLILENMRLKEDKRVLTKLLLQDTQSSYVEEKYVPFIESILFDTSSDEGDRLNYLVNYFINVDDISKEELLSCIQIVKETHDISSGALLDFEKYVEGSKFFS